MSAVDILQNNFTAGELSPEMYGRSDINRYQHGCKQLRNMRPKVQGGAKSSPAWRYVGEVKDSSKKTRLIRFEFSVDEAVIIEMGDLYFRFWNQDKTQVESGGSPYEIESIYSEADLFEIDYTSSADTIILFHHNYLPSRLIRIDNGFWVWEFLPLVAAPYALKNIYYSDDIALDLIASPPTVTAATNFFLDADVGRIIQAGGGEYEIKNLSSGTYPVAVMEIAILREGKGISFSSGNWSITPTPLAFCTTAGGSAIGDAVTLTLKDPRVQSAPFVIPAGWFDALLIFAKSSDEVLIPAPAGFTGKAGDSVTIFGCSEAGFNTTFKMEGYNLGKLALKHATRKFNSVTPSTPGSIIVEITSTLGNTPGWREEDVGSYVKINGGIIKLSRYNSTSVINGKIIDPVTAHTDSPDDAWKVLVDAWTKDTGYPRCGVFYEQRLVVAGSNTYPNRVWASAIAEFLNFEIGTDDDRAFDHDLSVDAYSPILHIARKKGRVVLLTSKNEHLMTGGVETPLTPTNIQVDDPSEYGSGDTKPVRVGKDVLFVQRGNKKLRALNYRFEDDDFSSTDLSKLAEHITDAGIVDMAYQQEPDSLVFCVLADGNMAVLTMDRDESVIAWSLDDTGGNWESIETLPSVTAYDDAWCVVRRVINGITKRYIESTDRSLQTHLHSVKTDTNGSPIAAWTGASHLAGKTVSLIGDGNYMGEVVVDVSGNFIAPRAVSAVEYGLPLPTAPTLETLPSEVIGQTGTKQGNINSIITSSIRFLETYPVKVNGEAVTFRQFGGNLLDQALTPFTGIHSGIDQGWGYDRTVKIEAITPFPIHVLSIAEKLKIGAS